MSIGNLARTSLLRDRESEQDCATGPFVKLRSLAAGAVLGVAIAAACGIVPAGAVTATGIAVGSVGGTPVGVTADRPIGDDAIKYFIPLKDSNGIYGTGYSCWPTGFGTCPDSGDGGGVLTMILKFSPVSMFQPSILSVVFEDLDLIGGSDPLGFFEKLRVVKSDGTPLTGWIDSLGLLVSGNADTQILSLLLGVLSNDPLYLLLKFKSHSSFFGTNTAEYLIATITSPDQQIPPVPLPGAVWLLGTVLLGSVGIAKWRKRRLA